MIMNDRSDTSMTRDDVSDYCVATATPGIRPLDWHRFISEAVASFGPFEWVTYIYLAWLETIVILFHQNVSHASKYFSVHLGLAFGIAALVTRAAQSRSRVIQFARHWYPLPLYIFFFEELQGLVHLIFPGWFDRWLIQFDFNFAGVHPSVWLAQFASAALNDAMQFAYMTYFLFLVILPAILYFEKKFSAFWSVMTATAIAHYSVYVIAVLVPVESPYFSLASLHSAPLEGGPFTATIELIEHYGRVHGAAFPSAHVAGSMVAVLAARRYKPWLFRVSLPFFVAMCVATVYGRYHYVADVIAGIAVGASGWAAGERAMEINERGPARIFSPRAAKCRASRDSRFERPRDTDFHCEYCRMKSVGIRIRDHSRNRCIRRRQSGSGRNRA
jgi:membrane-associated phospholipid phosphatase